jgi:hypothetical protein
MSVKVSVKHEVQKLYDMLAHLAAQHYHVEHTVFE